MALFIEKEEYEFLIRVERFCETIDKYVYLLGLDPVEVFDFKTDNKLFNYVFANQDDYGSLAESFARYKICNLQVKFSELVSECKCSKNYTAKIGNHLGINSSVPSADPRNYSPQIHACYTDKGQPILSWMKGVFHGVEIWKDCGNGKGYEKLVYCRRNEFIDKSPLPDECRVWKYSAILMYSDEMVGNWSDELEVIVHRG